VSKAVHPVSRREGKQQMNPARDKFLPVARLGHNQTYPPCMAVYVWETCQPQVPLVNQIQHGSSQPNHGFSLATQKRDTAVFVSEPLKPLTNTLKTTQK
jgi:hypothetical protein